MARQRPHGLSGARKAAVVIASLPRESASNLLSRLGRETAQAVGLELARLSDLPEGEAEEVLKEFVDVATSGTLVLHEGIDRARELLRAALPPEEADKAVSKIDATLLGGPFRFLANVRPESILAQLRSEQPQTIALVLAHVTPAKSAKILEGLPPRVQGEVVRRIAHMSVASGEALKRVEHALVARLGREDVSAHVQAGGVEQAVEILRRATRGTERSTLDSLDTDEPQLADEIRKRLFAFEDLLRADDRGIRALLREVTTQELSVALKTASEELKERFLSNLSSRARDLLAEEIEYMRPVRLSEVEAAQARILDAARRLEESGELFVAGRASGDEYVV